MNRSCILVVAALPVAALAAVPHTGFIHEQTHAGYVAFEAERTFAYVDVASGGYRLTPPGLWSDAAFAGEAIVPSHPSSSSANSRVEYRIRFHSAGTYLLHQRLSLLPMNGGDPERATTYDTHNSVYLPRAFGEIPNPADGTNTLTTRRKNLFSNSQWPFPHNGSYAWSTTESIIYHNYSLFPAHELVVTPAQVGQTLSLFIAARESGWAIDAIALVNTSILPLVEDAHFHRAFDGPANGLGAYNLDYNGDGTPDSFDFEKIVNGVGDGIPDAVYAPARHFDTGWHGLTPYALDYVVGYQNGLPVGDTHADTAIDINRDGVPDFETHFGGADPDGGVTPAFLDSLFIPEPAALLLAALALPLARRPR